MGHASKAPSSNNGATLVIILVSVIAAVFVLLLVCGGILVALLLPAVQQVRNVARQTETANQGKVIGLALNNYAMANREFPPAYLSDGDGQPIHSWRTMLLPYLEQQALFDTVQMDFPWNDPANSGIALNPVPAYQSPSGDSLENATGYLTHFVAIVDANTCLPADGSSVRSQDISDGTGRTIVLIDLPDSDIAWFEPRDLTIAEAIQSIQDRKQDTVAVFVDGSVKNLSPSLSSETLRALMTINGNEVVQEPF